MPFNNGRFALLAVLCSLAAQSLSPPGGIGARAAAVQRQPKAAQRNQFARHNSGKAADSDAWRLHPNQASFSFPRLRRGLSKQCNEVRNFGFLLQGISNSSLLQPRCQKRSIAISNVHGAKYTVHQRRQATTPQWTSMPQNATFFNNTASTSSSPDGTAGTVAIVSRDSNPDNDHVLASLFLVEQPDGNYVLDASDKNATEMFLTAVSPASSSDDGIYQVKLSMPLSDGPYCATYDQAPPTPEPLTAERCTTVEDRTGHRSQIFIYNSTSGVVQPTYVVGQAVDAGDVGTPSAASSASMSAGNAGVAASSDSASPTPSAGASSVSWSRRDNDSSYAAQNVTLVFRPKRVVANDAAAAAQVSTTTTTQTVVVYSSATPLSSSAVKSADAAPSQASAASSSGSAVVAGVTGLSVEVVGNALPSAAGFSSVGMAAAPSGSEQPEPSFVASSSPSPSMDAASASASYSAASTASAPPTDSSPSVVAVVASPSSSDNGVPSSLSPSPASSSAQAVFERSEVTPASTDPYLWRFKAGRFRI